MSRVDELQKKYPNLAREIIVKWEVLSQGIRDTATLGKVSTWDRGGSFQSRDHNVSLKDVVEKHPELVRPGYVMRPMPLYMKNGIGAIISRDSESPYGIEEVGEGRFALYEGQEKVEDIYFPMPKQRHEEALTSRGTPVTSLVTWPRAYSNQCFSIQPVRYCEYFVGGEQCKFCNYNATYDDARAVGLNPPITINLEDTVEAYKIISSNVRLVEGRFQSGAFKNSEQEANIHFRFAEKIATAASYQPNLCISTPPMDRKGIQRLKDSGLSSISFNLEVWGAEMFEAVCPGKARTRGFGRYLEAYQEAVDIFGFGGVSCNFVAGASMLPANGHANWEEARDSLSEGMTWLIKHGVMPTFHSVRLGVGSLFGDDKSSRAKLPPTEYYLDAALAHHQAMVENDFYHKINKFLACPLDCLANYYGGEVGILDIAGDPGSWLSDVIPIEQNWLARFVASVGETIDWTAT